MRPTAAGLTIQQLKVNQRVLVIGHIAGLRNGDGWFTPADALWLFDALRLPRPGDLKRTLRRLAGKRLVRPSTDSDAWAITPLGVEKATELLADVDTAQVEIELRGSPGSEFGHAHHQLISFHFAPTKWHRSIGQLLQESPFEQNVFLITRFPSSDGEEPEPDPIRAATNVIREALEKHELALHVASERQLADDLFGNVAAHMWACQYGIGILENRVGRGLNYNVMTEIGGMLMTGRRCALLKDTTAPANLPTDIAGHIYKPVDLDDLETVYHEIHGWVARDLALGRCQDCPEL